MYRDKLLQSVTVIDTETTNLHADQAEIVELAGAVYNGNTWHVTAQLFGATNGIPPEASAKTRISNRMINGLPTFNESNDKVLEIIRPVNSQFLVAHNCGYDQSVLFNSWTTTGNTYLAQIANDPQKWICTYRLAKQLIDFDFENMQYNLSYLRYRLDLPVDDELAAHRAGDDTLVCAVLFEFLLDYALAIGKLTDEADLGNQLHALCWQPLLYKHWPFGKNKGKLLSELPDDYYLWALQNLNSLNEDSAEYDSDLAESVAVELNRRFEQ